LTQAKLFTSHWKLVAIEYFRIQMCDNFFQPLFEKFHNPNPQLWMDDFLWKTNKLSGSSWQDIGSNYEKIDVGNANSGENFWFFKKIIRCTISCILNETMNSLQSFLFFSILFAPNFRSLFSTQNLRVWNFWWTKERVWGLSKRDLELICIVWELKNFKNLN